MSSPPQIQKICIVCGKDVAGQKRTKDAAGHYYCAPCYAAKSAPQKKSAPPPIPPPITRSQQGRQFVVRGTDRITGNDISVRVPAESQLAATDSAQANGIKWKLIYDSTETPKQPVVALADLDGWRAAEAARLNPSREKRFRLRWIPLLCLAVTAALAIWCLMDTVVSIGVIGQMRNDVSRGAPAGFYRVSGGATIIEIVVDLFGFVVLLGGSVGLWFWYRSWNRRPIMAVASATAVPPVIAAATESTAIPMQ